ncbi:HK97 gp10 family phage protein [Paenibacillus sp. TAB 01]|uniref:HK97 gp10 family phage protein n=1 Tax=Paenibacillus sp. TAB 01 TaxID=3368988 RepID=UPI003750B68B
MSRDVDTRQLDAFVQSLVDIATKTIPKESKKFLRGEGTKLRKATAAQARKSVNKKSNRYFKSIKRGRAYDFNGVPSIRVYSTAPHAHLIEDGHRIVGRDGTEHGFQPGLKVFERASMAFEDTYVDDVEAWVDKMLKEGKL